MIYTVSIWDNIVLIKKEIDADNPEQAMSIAKSMFPKSTLRYTDPIKVNKEAV